MATTYDRRINLYINGQQVANDVKSIRAEMTKLVNEQARMTIGSKEYIESASKIRQLKTILNEHNQQISAVSSSWSFKGMADNVNKYFGLITAGIASVTGVVMGFKQLVKTFNDFEERVSNLSALTGLAGDDLKWLSEKAKELSTSTLEGGIKVTQGAQEIVDAITKVGSARPELLKDKDALTAVAQEAIILSDAAKTELQPAIEALTMVMNQYNVPASEARRIINVLGAASKEGAGEIPYLTQAFEKSGTVAADAGISIETLAATIETLAPRITQPEIAGRSLKGVLLDLQTGSDDTNPKIVGLATALENLGKKNLTVTELTKKFGVENITTAKILIDNVGELKKYEKAVSGTNVALEQATINTDNNNAKLAQAKNRITLVSMELGEKLSPAMTYVTGWFGKTLKLISSLVDIFIEYKTVIFSATAGIIAYTVAVKLQAIWEERKNASSLVQIALSKAKSLAMTAEIAAVSLYNALQGLLSGNLLKAAQSMRVFNAALASNPIGLVVGILIAAGTALFMYSKELTAAEKAQKMLDDITLQSKVSTAASRIELEQLLRVAQNKKKSDEERSLAMTKINQISPEFLGNLTLEKINTDEAKIAVDKYIGSLERKAKIQAASEQLIDIEKELLSLQSGEGADTTFWQKAGAVITSFGSNTRLAMSLGEAGVKNMADRTAELTLKKEKLLQITAKENEAGPTTGNAGTKEEIAAQKDLIKLKEAELKVANEMPRTTEAEILARNKKIESIQNEIDRLNDLGTGRGAKKAGRVDKEAENAKEKAERERRTKELANIEAENSERIAVINKDHLKNIENDDQYHADLLSQELEYLKKKAEIYPVGSKEYEAAMMEADEKRVAAEKKVHELLLEAQKGLINAKIDNLKDGIEKEKAIEEQRYQEEIAALQDKMKIHDNLSKQEIALNAVISQSVEEKTREHNKRINDLNLAASQEKQITELNDKILHATSQKQKWEDELELAKEQYNNEFKLADGNRQKELDAEEKYKNKITAIKTEQNQVYKMLSESLVGFVSDAFSGQLDQYASFGQSLILMALQILKQLIPIWSAQIVGGSLATPDSIMTGGISGIVKFTALLAIMEGFVAVAEAGVKNSINSKKNAAGQKGHAEGGFTEPGGKYEPAGIVHKGEYVIPQEGVNNPALQPLFDTIERARVNKTLSRLDLRPVIQSSTASRVYANGGFTGGPIQNENQMVSISAGSDPELKTLMKQLNTTLKDGIRAHVNAYGTNGLLDALDKINSFKSKTDKK